MFVRDETQPVEWNGTTYRSVLEVNVAQELARLGIRSRYEKIPIRELEYLPDFKIDHLPDAGMAPASWIEVKPPEAIYAVRDHFNLPERFNEAEAFEMTKDDLAQVSPELMKPKGLAEMTGEPVLVASAINRNATVALVMFADFVEVTRQHPLVNWKRVLKDRDQAARRAQWEAQEARRRAEVERQRAEWQAQRSNTSAKWIEMFRASNRIPAKYDGDCVVCQDRVAAQHLVIAKFKASDGKLHWRACCGRHIR